MLDQRCSVAAQTSCQPRSLARWASSPSYARTSTTSRELTIKEPLFFSQEDENSFFRWLRSIPAVRRLVGTPEGLKLTLKEPDKLSIYELIAVMSRYQVDMRCLRDICESSKERAWFRRKRMYWYDSVYKG